MNKNKRVWAVLCLSAIGCLAFSLPASAQITNGDSVEELPKPLVQKAPHIQEAPPARFEEDEPSLSDRVDDARDVDARDNGSKTEDSVLKDDNTRRKDSQRESSQPRRTFRPLPETSALRPQPVSTTVQHRIVSQGNGHFCANCVDRTGRNAGMIGGFGIANGIGPCTDKDCECWQCPHNAPFQMHGPGDYAGPARTHRLPEYRLRTGDTIQLTYLVAPMKMAGAYRLVVGDEVMIESVADEDLQRGTMERGLKIQPDGTISLRLIGQVHAAGQSVGQLRDLLEELYKEFYPKPSIDVTPINTGTAARQVREAISGAGGFDPQSITQTITPEGEIRLPRIGSVLAQGLTMDELKEEINLRYDDVVGGLEVEPSLQSQAPHYFFVLGEVRQPGRYNMDTPTTVLGAMAMAGGQTVGANLRQVVIFRRGDDWELVSTLMDLRGAVLGRTAHPKDEIWLRDGDVIILPEAPIELFNNFVQQVFTEGIYGIIPLSASYNFGDSFN
ncbi:polysaccharide biosynthesis/export family protein [Stieleria marina]